MVRALDHIVMPVETLEEARARYQALGFTVNKKGVHPFGTANCCIFLGDDTYLEPIAIYDQESYNKAIEDKNSFILLDQAFRGKIAKEGVSALSLKSTNVDLDHRSFHAMNVAERAGFAFERENINADGKKSLLSVKGAFYVREDLPGAAVFTIEWLGEQEDIRAIRRAPDHPNTVRGVKTITYETGDLQSAIQHFEPVFDGTANPVKDGALSVLEADDLNIEIEQSASRSALDLCVREIGFWVDDISIVATLLTDGGIAFDPQADKIQVPPAKGQGVTFSFQGWVA